jgi:hypothetical protein
MGIASAFAGGATANKSLHPSYTLLGTAPHGHHGKTRRTA